MNGNPTRHNLLRGNQQELQSYFAKCASLQKNSQEGVAVDLSGLLNETVFII
jgi:hypothetical protein